MIRQNPKLLGKVSLFKTKVIQINLQNLSKLALHEKLQQLQKTNLKKHEQTKQKLIANAVQSPYPSAIQRTLHTLLGTTSHKDVKWATHRYHEQINQHKQRFGTEPSNGNKSEFFKRACFELNHKQQFQQHTSDLQKLDRILAIHSSYANPTQYQTLRLFRQSEQQIAALTREYQSQGLSEIKARFVATEIVKYHDKFSTHMPPKQVDFVKNIGNYVERNYSDLRRFNFSHKEALITYNEGSHLASKYEPSCQSTQSINKSDVLEAQQTSRNTLQNAQNLTLESNAI